MICSLKMTQKQRRRVERVFGKGDGKLVKDFLPAGRSGNFIYAVTVSQHPDKVKIGRTKSWKARRHAYANWNLAAGDAIEDERVFCICDEFVDLPKLENHILQTFPFPRAHGMEWFFASLEDAERHIDRVMCENALTYDL